MKKNNLFDKFIWSLVVFLPVIVFVVSSCLNKATTFSSIMQNDFGISKDNVVYSTFNSIFGSEGAHYGDNSLIFATQNYSSNGYNIRANNNSLSISSNGTSTSTYFDIAVQPFNIVDNTFDFSISNSIDNSIITPYINNNIWNTQTWSNYSSVYGKWIWNIGSTYYYSSGTTQYSLDTATNTWSAMTWNGLTNFYGNWIWNIGSTYYFSNGGSNQYVLDTATNTWSAMTWNGLSSFDGSNVWNIGSTYYYSNGGSYQYVLDTATNTWSAMTWNGISDFTHFTGSNVWNFNSTYYYSYGTSQYVLDTATNTWSAMTWNGLTNFLGSNVWNVGSTYYYSNGKSQYSLVSVYMYGALYLYGSDSAYDSRIVSIDNRYLSTNVLVNSGVVHYLRLYFADFSGSSYTQNVTFNFRYYQNATTYLAFFTNDTIPLFISYWCYVELLHLLVDLLVFIPRLVHNYLNKRLGD